MAVVVVCGSGRGAGKTALVCGLIAALPEFGWTAVKVTSHRHGRAEPVWEEREAGQGTDTARYLASGARRALLVTARDDELAERFEELRESLEPDAHVIFESNRVLEYLGPDVCLAVVGASEAKPSFDEAMKRADALVVREKTAVGDDGGKQIFELSASGVVSQEMRDWMRGRLRIAVRIRK